MSLDVVRSFIADKGFICPYATAGMKNQSIYVVEHEDLSQNPNITLHTPMVASAQNFLKDIRVTASLINVLDDSKLPINQANALSTSSMHQAWLALLQDKLYECLSDMFASVLIAHTGSFENFQETLEIDTHKGQFASPFLDRDAYRSWCKMILRLLSAQSNEGTFLGPKYEDLTEENRLIMTYLGPIYPVEHPRYMPRSIIVANKYRDLSLVRSTDNWKTSNKIMGDVKSIIEQWGQYTYDTNFFTQLWKNGEEVKTR